jgi:hypothetical protein
MATVVTGFIARLRDGVALPVLMKEMRSRMRGTRAPLLLFIGTGLAVLVGLLILMPQWSDLGTREPRYAVRAIVDAGRSLFIGLMVLEAILCAVVAPAVTAGAISIEREQQTLEFLLITRLSGANIALGKLASALGLIVMLLLCALPVGALSFLLGAVAPDQLLWAMAVLLSVVLLFGCIGLYCSARYRKTATSVAVAYLVCIAWLGLPALIMGVLSLFTDVLGPHMEIASLFTGLTLYFIAASLLAAPFAALFSWVASLIKRRPMSRLVNLALWGAFVVGFCALLNLPDVFSLLTPEALLFGNPIIAFVLSLFPETNALLSGYSGSALTSVIIDNFRLFTLVAQALFSGLLLSMTVAELRRQRD